MNKKIMMIVCLALLLSGCATSASKLTIPKTPVNYSEDFQLPMTSDGLVMLQP